MNLQTVLTCLNEYGIDETISLYGYMNTSPYDGTFEMFFFDGQRYYKVSTNPDRPSLSSTYKTYYNNEKDFLVNWLRNRAIYYECKDEKLYSIFKELLDKTKTNM